MKGRAIGDSAFLNLFQLMNFINKDNWLPIFACVACIPLCNSVYAEELQSIKSCLSVGIGLEQLSYTETVSELSLTSSDTNVNNLVLYIDIF